MTQQRPINLNPEPHRMEVLKITHPPIWASRAVFQFEPMRFIPHDGKAKS